MELMLTFGVPVRIQSDAGGEFTGKVVQHLCTYWLKVNLTHGPVDFARSQGGVERLGGCFRRLCLSCVSLGL